MKPQEIDRIENAIRHIQTAADVDEWAAEIAVEAMRKQIPIIDAVEVVRCKDCKHYTYKHSLPNVKNCHTKHCTRSAHIWTKPNDYCSYGERGDSDDET